MQYPLEVLDNMALNLYILIAAAYTMCTLLKHHSELHSSELTGFRMKVDSSLTVLHIQYLRLL